MTVLAPELTAKVLPDVPVSMREDSGRITLDASRAPHVSATVTLSMPDAALLDDLDPRDNRRVEITAGGRVFDLGIREANPNRSDATVELSLASDEALLGDFAQLVDDNGPRAHEASLRAVVDYVLDKIDADLEAGSTDADVTAFWEITNLLANPGGEADPVTNWATGAGASALARTGLPRTGDWAIRFTAAAGEANIVPTSSSAERFAVQPGNWYVFSFYGRSSAATSMRAVIQWWTQNGAVLSSASFGTAGASSTTAYGRYWVIAQAPAGVTHAYPYVNTTGNTAGRFHYVDDAMFYEGNEIVPAFNGSSTLPGYVCAWQAEPHKSASTRTPVLERSPESLLWKAGVSGLAFLAPLVQAAGFRLVCNERREWTLRDAEYREAGTLTFREGVNIVTVDEQLSRDSDTWYDGAVIEYTYDDVNGIEQVRADAYALTPTPTKVIRREIRAAYPGPGRAQYAVQRAQGKGRTVTATKQATWQEAAEQAFSAVLEATPIQIGTAEKVEFDLAGNEVTVTSRTTDTPAGAIVLLAGTINNLPGTINTL